MVSFRSQTCRMYQVHSSLCVSVHLVKMTALYFECFQVTYSAMITAIHLYLVPHMKKTNYTSLDLMMPHSLVHYFVTKTTV
jgi:hypothetical protein